MDEIKKTRKVVYVTYTYNASELIDEHVIVVFLLVNLLT